jgi:arsenate reductase
MLILVNPSCSKCQEALDIAEHNHCDFTVRNYLEEPLNEKEIRELVRKIGCTPEDLVRKTEPLFIERYGRDNQSDDDWIKILAENPILLQRPIVITGNRAIIGRPPALILDLLRR